MNTPTTPQPPILKEVKYGIMANGQFVRVTMIGQDGSAYECLVKASVFPTWADDINDVSKMLTPTKGQGNP